MVIITIIIVILGFQLYTFVARTIVIVIIIIIAVIIIIKYYTNKYIIIVTNTKHFSLSVYFI